MATTFHMRCVCEGGAGEGPDWHYHYFDCDHDHAGVWDEQAEHKCPTHPTATHRDWTIVSKEETA